VIRQQFARFVVVGVVSNGALYAIYLLLTRASLTPKSAMSVGYVLGILMGFAGNRFWSFRQVSPGHGALGRYVLAYGAGYVLNWVGLDLGTRTLQLPHEAVQAVMVVLVALLMFALQKYFVFAKAPGRDAEGRRRG